MNRKEVIYKPISEEEREFAEQMLKNDSEKLKDKFEISF